MDFINDLQSTWANPQMRHALLLHWPIVLSVLAMLFVLAMAINKAKNPLLRCIALLMCLGVMVSGYMTMQSGISAEDTVRSYVNQAQETLHEHEELGEKVPYFGAVCAVLVALSFIPRPKIRIGAAWLAALACAITAMLLANTAHYGGLLVYKYGLASPQPVSAAATTGSDRPSSDQKVAFFRQRVFPVLELNCFKCHNAAKVANGKSGGLDQTSLATLLKGGRSGAAIVSGKPEDSLLIHRLRDDSDDDRMPPPPNVQLPANVIADLEQWIRDGAVWDNATAKPADGDSRRDQD